MVPWRPWLHYNAAIMMHRVAHVLLSLLLLVSQQMAFAHAMAHWTGRLGTANALSQRVDTERARDLSSSVAQDGSCSHCLAFAQMACAIGGAPRQFIALDPGSERACGFTASQAAPRTVCAFDSRAPPAVQEPIPR